MTRSDVSLLAKKILVGFIVTLVPFFIIAGGLWLTQSILGGHPMQKTNLQHKLKSTAYENANAH